MKNSIIILKGVILLKTLIIYESRFGTVKKAVDFIAVKLTIQPEIMTSKEAIKTNLAEFDTIIIGGSIMAGKIQKDITAFITSRLSELLTKKIALFLAAGTPDKELLKKEISEAYPQALRDKSLYTAHIGYEYDFSKLNFIFKVMIKKIAKVYESVSSINYEELDKLVLAVIQ